MKDQLFLLKNTMNQVLRGKEDIIRKVFAAVFAGGHLGLQAGCFFQRGRAWLLGDGARGFQRKGAGAAGHVGHF